MGDDAIPPGKVEAVALDACRRLDLADDLLHADTPCTVPCGYCLRVTEANIRAADAWEAAQRRAKREAEWHTVNSDDLYGMTPAYWWAD